MGRIILASASPRRKEILAKITPDFDIVVSDCDETVDEGLLPEEVVKILAQRKAEAVAGTIAGDALIIASDTVVVLNHKILGKPLDEDSAIAMLKSLSGRTHNVFSGVCILNKSTTTTTDVFYEKTQVEFEAMDDSEIAEYVASKEPMDKAGAYGIQGLAGKFIKGINGDYYNVMGLPLAALYKHLKNYKDYEI